VPSRGHHERHSRPTLSAPSVSVSVCSSHSSGYRVGVVAQTLHPRSRWETSASRTSGSRHRLWPSSRSCLQVKGDIFGASSLRRRGADPRVTTSPNAIVASPTSPRSSRRSAGQRSLALGLKSHRRCCSPCSPSDDPLSRHMGTSSRGERPVLDSRSKFPATEHPARRLGCCGGVCLFVASSIRPTSIRIFVAVGVGQVSLYRHRCPVRYRCFLRTGHQMIVGG
jgi:hypothetical protein